MALNRAHRKVEEKAFYYYFQHHQADAVPAAHTQEAARLLDELTQLPLLDNRMPDEILGYDKDGLLTRSPDTLSACGTTEIKKITIHA
ncbi:hypothetical protein [Candidatus Electrothrix sp.]|uniref:hypothetical protein n=1 Tax=Candidatus Electrothrix sp. TaxID=2170559 RepID=UPI0040564142